MPNGAWHTTIFETLADGKRFFNPTLPQARGFLDALVLEAHQPSGAIRHVFVSDVEQPKPPSRVQFDELRVTSSSTIPRCCFSKATVTILLDPIWAERGKSTHLDRPTPPQKAGSAVGGSSAHRGHAVLLSHNPITIIWILPPSRRLADHESIPIYRSGRG